MPVVDLHHLLLDVEAGEADEDAERAAVVEEVDRWVAFLAEVRQGDAGDWRRDAACRGHAEVMFPRRGEPDPAALALCEACPVTVQCEQWGDEHPQQLGVIAGRSESARRAARRSAA